MYVVEINSLIVLFYFCWIKDYEGSGGYKFSGEFSGNSGIRKLDILINLVFRVKYKRFKSYRFKGNKKFNCLYCNWF